MEGSSKDTMDTAGQHSAEKKDQGSTSNSEIASLLKTLAAYDKARPRAAEMCY